MRNNISKKYSGLLGANNEGLTGNVHPDLALFAFSTVLSLVSGPLFGLLPAWRASRAEPIEAMRRASVHRAGKASLASRALIAVQVALSLALLFGAGLFRQTLDNLRSVDLGFRPENLVLMHVDLSGTPRAAAAGPFFDELLARANASACFPAAWRPSSSEFPGMSPRTIYGRPPIS